MKTLVTVAVAACMWAGSLSAQRLERAGVSRLVVGGAKPAHAADVRVAPARDMVVGGVFGSLFLGAVGGFAGYSLVKDCQELFCELGGIVIGTLAGEALGVPVGVRAAGGQGSFAGQVLISSAVLAVGVIAAPVTMGFSLLPVIPVQIALVVNSAKDTTRTEAPR